MDDRALRGIYERTETIAIVGASTDPAKAAHRIPRYLAGQGFAVVPVNPTAEDVLDEDAYDSLDQVEEDVDVVDVFRPADEVPAIAGQAVAIGARVLWLQTGIASEEGRRIAEEGGLTVVEDRCMGATHGRLGLGPGPG